MKNIATLALCLFAGSAFAQLSTTGDASLTTVKPAWASTARTAAAMASDVINPTFFGATADWLQGFTDGTIGSAVATTAATSAGSYVLTFSAVPTTVAAGQTVLDLTSPSVIPSGTTVSSTTATTVTMSASATGVGVANGDVISITGSTVFRSSSAVFTANDCHTGSHCTGPADKTKVLDSSNAGLAMTDRPVFSVQHHPEASPGPVDSLYLFERFAELMDAHRG